MDAAEAAAPLVALIRRLRPHVLLTYDETGGYGHPDHIKTHDISVVAFEAAGDPTRYPEAGEPWQPSKLYYHETFHKARVQALHDTMVANGIESHWGERLAQWVDRPEDAQRITTRVSCAEYFDVRDRALLAHETQVDPAGLWFRCPVDLQRIAWPTEDYRLARSLVETSLPEDDLFASSTAPGQRAADDAYAARVSGAQGFVGVLGAVLGADSKKASGIGLVVILALIAACIFLFRSLNARLRRLPPTFDAVEPPRLPEPADPADDALAAARGEVPRAGEVSRAGEVPRADEQDPGTREDPPRGG
jgi:LmbE family N-acetylglucosaminyl deacetylase